MTWQGADLDLLRRLRTDLGRRQHEVRSTGDDAGDAVARFLRRSSEFVPCVPDHGEAADALADQLDVLAERVEATHTALVAADRWVGHRVALAGYELVETRATIGDVRALTPRSWQQARELVRVARGGPVPGRLADTLDGWAWRSMSPHAVARLERLATTGRGGVGATLDGWGRWSQLRDVVPAGVRSRLSLVGRVGGRAFAVAGVVTAGVDVVTGIRDRDTERAVTGAFGTVASVAMLSGCPPFQVAGAVVAGGLLLYEHRERIADAAGELADAGRALLDGAARALSGLF